MKHALLAGAVIAASFFIPPANAQMIVVYGRGPAQDCYRAAAAGHDGRSAVALCNLALNHDFLTREDRAATFINRGVLYLRRGAETRALSDFDDALALDSNLGEAQLMRGVALVQLARYSEAIDTLTQALAMNPEGTERAYYYRGAAYEELGDAQAAYADYQRAADLAPNWASPRTELARFRVG